MLKTYRIIPVVFILFFFGFTLFTVAPVFAQTPISMEQLIERIQKLEVAVFHAGQTASPGLESADGPMTAPAENTIATVEPNVKMNGPWDPSMGMRHPDRPCMKTNSCGLDRRNKVDKERDPYDIGSYEQQLIADKDGGYIPSFKPAAECIQRGSRWVGGRVGTLDGRCVRR